MARVNREEFLSKLRLLQPGLSPADSGVDQSDCFVFHEGRVCTFNDEVACRVKTTVPIEGAVTAQPLLSLLEKLTEDEVDVEVGEGELLVFGKKRRAGITMEAQVTLPIHTVEQPEEWRKVPDDLAEAVSLVEGCAGRNELEFNLTCVHIHPEWVEASDNTKIARYSISSGVTEPILVNRDAIRYVAANGPTKMAETPKWVHFKSPSGPVISLRRFVVEDYPDWAEFLEVGGEELTFPKGLHEAAQRAAVFASANAENKDVTIRLKPGSVTCRGEGSFGWFSETRKVPGYSGQALEFTISPAILSEVVKKHSGCVVSNKQLKINGGKWQFVACLGITERPTT